MSADSTGTVAPAQDPGHDGSAPEIEVRGPYFDELSTGQVFDTAPAVTLTDGLAAAHQAIVGERFQIALSRPYSQAVAGVAQIASPGLVVDAAIGQSTLVTQHVRANLFYRGLVFRRMPLIGDTLSTVTTIEGLKQNRAKPGRAATGMAVLRVTTVDQEGRSVLDFWRCAMLPTADPDAVTGHDDDLTTVGRPVSDDELTGAITGWSVPAARFTPPQPGQRYRLYGADAVSSAPELARLTLNVAAIHHDAVAAGGRRLVYGGHTIGIALSQATRALPDLLTVVAWHSCDHVAPVHEDDRLTSVVEIERVEALPDGGRLVHLRSVVSATGPAGGEPTVVLDWRFVGLHA
jgi:acyl dehydratase